MVFGKDVRVEWDKRDRYKRIVGKVWVQPESCPTCPMTLDAGHAQITVGLAWWYRKYARNSHPRIAGRTSSPSRRLERSASDCGAILIRFHLGSGVSVGVSWRLAAGDPQRPVAPPKVMRQVIERSGHMKTLLSPGDLSRSPLPSGEFGDHSGTGAPAHPLSAGSSKEAPPFWFY